MWNFENTVSDANSVDQLLSSLLFRLHFHLYLILIDIRYSQMRSSIYHENNESYLINLQISCFIYYELVSSLFWAEMDQCPITTCTCIENQLCCYCACQTLVGL